MAHLLVRVISTTIATSKPYVLYRDEQQHPKLFTWTDSFCLRLHLFEEDPNTSPPKYHLYTLLSIEAATTLALIGFIILELSAPKLSRHLTETLSQSLSVTPSSGSSLLRPASCMNRPKNCTAAPMRLGTLVRHALLNQTARQPLESLKSKDCARDAHWQIKADKLRSRKRTET